MSEQKINLEVSITRNSSGTIRIYFYDADSRIEFAHAEMTPDAFGQCVTGISHIECVGVVRGLEAVGKKRVHEARRAFYAGSADKATLQQWLMDNKQEEGWILNPYLGYQSSVNFSHTEQGYWLNYSVHKYVASNSPE